MKKLFKSLFQSSDSAEASSSPPPPEPAPAATAPPQGHDEVVSDLRRCISSASADPLPPEEIDTSLHMYDAGYITSMSAADLLAHIETRYGVYVRETDLVGRLQTLEALAQHVAEASPRGA